jgi:hypothetical protein
MTCLENPRSRAGVHVEGTSDVCAPPFIPLLTISAVTFSSFFLRPPVNVVTMVLNAKPSRFLAAFLLLVAAAASSAFQVAPSQPLAAGQRHRSSFSSSGTAIHVFGNKKQSSSSSSSAQDALLERARRAGVSGGFWEGEWVCKDCGYIYNRVRFFVHRGLTLLLSARSAPLSVETCPHLTLSPPNQHHALITCSLDLWPNDRPNALACTSRSRVRASAVRSAAAPAAGTPRR